jgi:large subunit ribosomal protein L18
MKLSKSEARTRRHYRVRSIVSGTPERPRVCIFRSNRHITVQAIDDVNGATLASVGTVKKESDGKNHCNVATAQVLGREMASRLKEKNIDQVVFDRNGYLYHGVVKAFADALRAADEQNHFHF